MAGLIPQSVEPQAQVTLATLCVCHKSGECANLYARRSVCFCPQIAGGASIRLLRSRCSHMTQEGELLSSVRLALKLSYKMMGTLWIKSCYIVRVSELVWKRR